ncbi:MAG: AraC family transcriptional regulator, partial [Burkholderiales bacterium]|nr:AraC family transcriptional regulator [Opitutaceae bacterium]
LSMAASLLRGTTRTILEIGQLVGFESPSSLNRQFRARYGKSPRSWRDDLS